MIINDSIYGEQDIDNQLILELLSSKPMQRLKKINQHGTVDIGINRFDHSVGVFLLLKKLGASFEEQIAGLLHDINHSAISHILDFVYSTKNHDYTERFHKQIISDSEIPEILKKESINVHSIAELHRFKLLEKNMPDLCADRLDYLFRDSHAMGYITKKEISELISALAVFENQIVMKDRENAKRIAELYLKTCETLWAEPGVAGHHQFFANIIKRALELKIITENDFFVTDEEFMDKLKTAKDELIQTDLKYNWKQFCLGTEEDHDIFVRTKPRHIDPLFLEEGVLKRLSTHDADYKKRMDDFIIKVNQGFFVKIKQ